MTNPKWEFVKFTLIAVLIVVPIRLWIAQPFIVSGKSMEPTFHNGDYLIVDELSYNFNEPQKNDVIIFRYPLEPSKYYIKRIEGLPGEKIKTNGKEITLGENEYYVLGDNRGASSDSRSWGPLKENFIVGRAFVRLWPFNNLGVLPGQQTIYYGR
jgi:signal peptidase I